MNFDNIIRQFDSIESRLETLINNCQVLKAENKDQQQKIQLLEEELAAKIKAEKTYLEERALVKSKIDKLLGKLEDFNSE